MKAQEDAGDVSLGKLCLWQSLRMCTGTLLMWEHRMADVGLAEGRAACSSAWLLWDNSVLSSLNNGLYPRRSSVSWTRSGVQASSKEVLSDSLARTTVPESKGSMEPGARLLQQQNVLCALGSKRLDKRY